MVRHGYITQAEADAANAIPITSLLKEQSKEGAAYASYIDTVIEELQEVHGINPYTTPVEIYTNMDSEKQKAIDDIFNGVDIISVIQHHLMYLEHIHTGLSDLGLCLVHKVLKVGYGLLPCSLKALELSFGSLYVLSLYRKVLLLIYVYLSDGKALEYRFTLKYLHDIHPCSLMISLRLHYFHI